MDMYEACTKFAENIEAGKYYDVGLAIQFFYEELDNDETPRMALALVNKTFEDMTINEWKG